MEGANYASVEYLLAGLSIVSTPSISGGREVYFDPEFCIVCDPDHQHSGAERCPKACAFAAHST